MMPVVAAIIVPIRVTASARPPGTRRIRTCRQCSRSLATPLRSSMVPMKMNMGIAVSTRFSAMPPQIRGATLKNWMKEKTSKYMPTKPKASPMPPSTKATG